MAVKTFPRQDRPHVPVELDGLRHRFAGELVPMRTELSRPRAGARKRKADDEEQVKFHSKHRGKVGCHAQRLRRRTGDNVNASFARGGSEESADARTNRQPPRHFNNQSQRIGLPTEVGHSCPTQTSRHNAQRSEARKPRTFTTDLTDCTDASNPAAPGVLVSTAPVPVCHRRLAPARSAREASAPDLARPSAPVSKADVHPKKIATSSLNPESAGLPPGIDRKPGNAELPLGLDRQLARFGFPAQAHGGAHP